METAMQLRSLVLSVLILAVSSTFAHPSELAFKPAGEGLFEFDTGVLKGTLKLDGKYQGVYPLIHVPSGAELVHAPGVFSFYRVLTTNHRYGNAARDWPTRTRLLPDGAVEARWPSAEEHPLEMTGVYRWAAADTLDLQITVTPQQDMPRFELFMSSYFTQGFLASVYLKSDGHDEAKPRFVPVNRKPDSKGGYVMFPRDEQAAAMIRDGRWQIPPNPVDWAVERWLAAPLAVRRDEALGLSAVMISRPGDCFAVASPWNPASPDARGYRSLYLSLFGRDLQAGETAEARCRLILAERTSDVDVVNCYRNYVGKSAGD